MKQPWNIERRKHIFCSKKCHDVWRSEHQRGEAHQQYNRVTVTCAQCGKEMQCIHSKAQRNERHYCSKGCHDNWMRDNPLLGADNPNYNSIVVQCAHCGSDILRQPWQANGYKYQFCNRACHAAWRAIYQVGPACGGWRGGHQKYYGPNWLQQRRAARERDGYTCQHCGATEAQLGRELDVHHIVPFREFGYVRHTNDAYLRANDLANLISLCVTCHKATEWKT
jgi:endogenous inhibitor of DNA gyrase (YacG/DUF329 family)